MASYLVETFGQLEPFVRQEWLLTNGLGGFAFSTVVGCNTRRYHGLLVAATLPPVGRIVALNRIGEMLVLDGDAEHPHELAVNRFRNAWHPRGDRYLQKFGINDHARWEYTVEDVRVTKELQIPWHKNVVGIRYTIEAPPKRNIELRLFPFISLRDFHGALHAAGYDMPTKVDGPRLAVSNGGHTLHARASDGQFIPKPCWWYGHVYPIETERGMDDTEDLFNPGYFQLNTSQSRTVTIWCALEQDLDYDWDAELDRRRQGIGAAIHIPQNVATTSSARPDQSATPEMPATLQKLACAANDFVVCRKSPDGKDGSTVIAGYPWFADWGRDTMISLPGLFFATRRFEQAKQVLGVFASYVNQGMIPNRFDDYTNEPHYNTVDASLWFIHACFEYQRLAEDRATFDTVLRPACCKIIEGYRRGTRFKIAMDPADGLITQGDEQTQLTWMDAKCEGVCFTPRAGKPVEINALWYHALMLMGETKLAAQVAESFRNAFWISPFRGLADVVSGTPSNYECNTQLRPTRFSRSVSPTRRCFPSSRPPWSRSCAASYSPPWACARLPGPTPITTPTTSATACSAMPPTTTAPSGPG